jgi:2-dehydropantoate 2-reductase
VVFEATLDRLFNEPEMLGLVRAVMLEAMTVGACYGVRFALDPATRIDVGRRLGAFRTSMLQDHDRGRPLEIGAIVGAVLELADRAEVPMPVTRHILHQVQLAQLGGKHQSAKPLQIVKTVQSGAAHKEKP